MHKNITKERKKKKQEKKTKEKERESTFNQEYGDYV